MPCGASSERLTPQAHHAFLNATFSMTQPGRIYDPRVGYSRIRTESVTPAAAENAGTRTRLRFSSRQAERGILTFKSPIEILSGAATTPSQYKHREELEIEFAPAGRLDFILRSLGFHPGFIYEKYRTAYRLKRVKGLILDLDETPIGNYLELEGPPAAIDRAAKLLGFAPQDYITDTYWDLYVAHCRGHRLTPGNLVFSHRKK